MMPQDNMPQDNPDEEAQEKQQMDMIKTTLQKLIDDMNGMESDRISAKPGLPADTSASAPDVAALDVTTPVKPGMAMGGEVKGYSTGSAGIPKPNENDAESPYEAEPENQDNQHEELDPTILKDLIAKATTSDDDGSLPEDTEHEFPQEIQNAINEKRKRGRNIVSD